MSYILIYILFRFSTVTQRTKTSNPAVLSSILLNLTNLYSGIDLNPNDNYYLRPY